MAYGLKACSCNPLMKLLKINIHVIIVPYQKSKQSDSVSLQLYCTHNNMLMEVYLGLLNMSFLQSNNVAWNHKFSTTINTLLLVQCAQIEIKILSFHLILINVAEMIIDIIEALMIGEMMVECDDICDVEPQGKSYLFCDVQAHLLCMERCVFVRVFLLDLIVLLHGLLDCL